MRPSKHDAEEHHRDQDRHWQDDAGQHEQAHSLVDPQLGCGSRSLSFAVRGVKHVVDIVGYRRVLERACQCVNRVSGNELEVDFGVDFGAT